jgi:hypothetical protein
MESETNSETNSNSNVLQDRQEIAAKIAILAVLGTWESANVWSFPMRPNVEGKYHHLVKSRAQFNELWAQMRNEVATARLISLDFEERRLSDQDMKNMAMVFDKEGYCRLGVNLVVVGTVFTTYTFDIRAMRHEMGDKGVMAPIGLVLPSQICQMLQDPTVLVIGSGIRDDLKGKLEQMGLDRVNGIVDTQLIWTNAMKHEWIIAEDSDRRKCGMDVQARWAFNIDESHKTTKCDNYKQALAMPYYRSFLLYEWPEPLDEHELGYCHMDARTPIKFVLKLLIRNIRKEVIKIGRRNLADVLLQEIPAMTGGLASTGEMRGERPDLIDLTSLTKLVKPGHPLLERLQKIQQAAEESLLLDIENFLSGVTLDDYPVLDVVNVVTADPNTVYQKPKGSEISQQDQKEAGSSTMPSEPASSQAQDSSASSSKDQTWSKVERKQKKRRSSTSSTSESDKPTRKSNKGKSLKRRPRHESLELSSDTRQRQRDKRRKHDSRGRDSRRSPSPDRRRRGDRGSDKGKSQDLSHSSRKSAGKSRAFQADREANDPRPRRKTSVSSAAKAAASRSSKSDEKRKDSKPQPKVMGPPPPPRTNAWASGRNPITSRMHDRAAAPVPSGSANLEPIRSNSDQIMKSAQYVREQALKVSQALDPANIQTQSWKREPDLGHLCRSCGTDSCRSPNCTPPERMQGCTYPVCMSKTHRIAMCDVLHGRCSSCDRRGHYSAICSTRTEQQWFNLFEGHRLLGYYTKMADVYINWGFFIVFPMILDDPKLPKYTELLKMFANDTRQIQQFLDSLARRHKEAPAPMDTEEPEKPKESKQQ